MFRNINEVDNYIYEACQSNCYECSTKDEEENDKENSVVEKADLIIKKDMEHKKRIRENSQVRVTTNLWNDADSSTAAQRFCFLKQI